MEGKVKTQIKFYADSLVNSYAQVFFSNNLWLAILVLVASFIDPYTGAAGLICVLATVLFAKLLGFNQLLIRNGVYSYNALLVGLTLGVFFKFTLPFFVLLLLASFLTLLITVWLSGMATAYRVPFLSTPFMVSVWIFLLSGRSLSALQLSERGIYTSNDLWKLGGSTLVSLYESINSLKIPTLVEVYLKSLGAIVFEYNIVAGALIALGMLIYSRIAFTLSILGFLTGYLFCVFFQGNVTELEYSYIGFNYILAAIAIGGFFLIPSKGSYFMAIISAPLIGLIISALGNILGVYHLPIYSLPFSLVVILLVYVLVNRYEVKHLFMVQYQQYSPEKNLYALVNRTERFKNDTYYHIGLPFYGEWNVSQAHEGDITHKEDWRFAWDFVVTDETRKTFKLPGTSVTDFYCYGLPVLAPSAGYVVAIEDGVEDNEIGSANIAENWGNSIVIKHGDYFYSQISHIKKGSFKCKVGDYVKKGDILALCGNSGRSPEPHIHFQLQATPNVGAATLKYPISYYVARENGEFVFHSFEYPKQEQIISKVVPTPLVQSAFSFTLGKTISFKVTGKKTETVKWEVFVDTANNPYIYCHNTGSYAYFANNETLHYFTDFKGDKKSLLYYFYIGAHKILLSYFHQLEVKDVLPAEGFMKGPSKIIQDFIAPFKVYQKTEFTARYSEIDDERDPKKIKIESVAMAKTGKSINRKLEFTLELENSNLQKFTVKEKDLCITAEHLD